ncbi:hypothetical protein ABPG72_008468 [Tetrahymena utriculariae]
MLFTYLVLYGCYIDAAKQFEPNLNDQNLKLIITKTDTPLGFSCSVYEQIQIATCYQLVAQDARNYALIAYAFSWQNIQFILDQNGDKLQIGLLQLANYEIFNLDHQSIIQQENVYHIYSTLRQIVPGSETLTYFLNYGQVKDENSYAFSQATSQLMFRQKNSHIAAQRFGQFGVSKSSTYSSFLFSISDLGIIADLTSDNQLQFLSIDNLEVLQKISAQIGTKVFYSKKFQKLILNNGNKITVYNQDNLFEKQSYIYDLEYKQQKPKCPIYFILNETSYLVCNKFGLFDFQNKIFYENQKLIACDSRQLPKIYENQYYALFNTPSNLFVFSHQKKQDLKNVALSEKIDVYIKIILHPEISDQIVLIDDGQCKIYQLPDFYLLFEQTQQYQNQDEFSECFYNLNQPSLIFRTAQKLAIHKLPYSIYNVPQTFNLSSSSRASKYGITQNYLYILSSQRLYDYSRAIYFEQISLITGNYKATNMILTEAISSNTFQYWEEKEIIFSNELLVSTGDIQFGWSSEQKLLDYFDIFNYFLQLDQNGNNQELKSLDFCEMFPFNKQSSQFLDIVDIASSNYYFLNQGVEQILYFNSEQFLIQQSSFGNDNYQQILDVYDALLNKDYRDLYSDELNNGMLIIYESQNSCVLYLNGQEKLKSISMNIESQKISLVKFTSYGQISLLIIGQFDSIIQIIQLLNPISDQIEDNYSN